MKTRFVYFHDDNTDKLTKFYSDLQGNDNKLMHNKLKRIMLKYIKGELTELQRYCITEYYYNNRRQKDIARELGVAPSTVSRHITRSVKKLKEIASYYN